MCAIELFQDKKDCCGCGACMNICPKNAIAMQEDEYGFVYPRINTELCVECGMCQKVCGYQNCPDKHMAHTVYAAAAKDSGVLQKSASGGIFAALALQAMKNGGVIYGAALLNENGKLEPRHIRIDGQEELGKLQGSKYVQSDIGFTYQQAQKDLSKGRPVLFSGTPCQIAGLKQYLGQDYENLLTVEIICHGVPSKSFFQDFIDHYGKQLGKTITQFYFRDKSKGQGMTTRTICSNGSEVVKNSNLLSYVFLFLKSHTYRENCYSCPFATSERIADLTLGDFWGFHEEYPDCNIAGLSNEKGVSCVLACTEKGMEALAKNRNALLLREAEFDKAAKHNEQLHSPSKRGALRETILKLYQNQGYGAVDRYYKAHFWKERAVQKVSGIFSKNFKRRVKRLLGKAGAIR